jgi:hypothetical protein
VLQRDLDAAWAAIGLATVDDKERSKSCWQDWWRYAIAAQTDPYLRGLDRSGRQNVLLAFATWVCTGLYGKAWQVDISQWRKPYGMWRKPSNWLDTMTPGKPMGPKSSTYRSVTS